MLAISPPPTKRQKFTPNLLPCAIKHNGPIKTSLRHWSPSTNPSDKTSNSYFRGRKLRGRTVKLPEGYTGLVLQKTEKLLESENKKTHGLPVPEIEQEDEEDEFAMKDDGEDEEVKVMEQKGMFDEVVVWGHEVVPGEEDEYVKGIEEWIAFSRTMHDDTYEAQTK